MKKVFRNVLIALLLVTMVAGLIIQLSAKSQVSNFLNRKIPSHIKLSFDDIDVNVLSGKIQLHDISIDFFNRDTALSHTTAKMETLTLDGLGYWKFLMANTISADELNLKHPEVLYYSHKRVARKDTLSQGVVQLLKTIKLEKLSIDDGRFLMYKEGADSVQVMAPNINFSIYDLKTDSELIKEKIPLVYGNYTFNSSEIFVNLGPYEKLDVNQFELTKENLKIEKLNLISKYDKSELSKVLKTERDHIDLKIPEVNIRAIDFGFKKERFFVAAEFGSIQGPQLNTFRDKLVADNIEEQQLYGTLLRNLPIDIAIDEVEVVDGNIVYEELVKTGNDAGKISINSVNVLAKNISNTYGPGEKTLVEADAKLMNTSPLHLEWGFDATDENDAMTASGSVLDFDSKKVNQFLEANLGVQANGKIDALYFTINGNKLRASGDMKMNYRNFKFAILKRNRLGINKLLSAIGNLFINDGSKTDTDGFRHGKISVERDPTKSFFNYLWINVRDGIGSTLTGDGKKKKK